MTGLGWLGRSYAVRGLPRTPLVPLEYQKKQKLMLRTTPCNLKNFGIWMEVVQIRNASQSYYIRMPKTKTNKHVFCAQPCNLENLEVGIGSAAFSQNAWVLLH